MFHAFPAFRCPFLCSWFYKKSSIIPFFIIILFMFLHFFTNKENQKVIYLIKTIVNKKTDKWYIEWQRVTTNDNEWHGWQQMATSGKEWQQVVILANFPFFFEYERNLPLRTLKRLFKHWGVSKRDYWSKNRNKPLRRDINRKNQVSRQFSCLWYIQL